MTERGYRMTRADEVIFVDGSGTTSLEGIMYDGDPATGGRPLVGLTFLTETNGQESMTGMVGLTLNHVAGLIAELLHRVEVMGYGTAVRAEIDQHAAGVKEFALTDSERAVPICAGCGARPRRTESGLAVFDHEPGCEAGS